MGHLQLLPPPPGLNQDFLDRHSDVVYVTFGSRVIPPPMLIRSVGDALVAGGWAVVWSLKRANQLHLPRGGLWKYERDALPKDSAENYR